MIEVPDDVVYNLIMDLKKKDIDPFDKAKILKAFRERHKWSQRQLSRELNIPHSTIQDWERWNSVNQEEYDKMLSDGLNHRDIYRQIRNNSNNINNIKDKLKIDVMLEDAIRLLEPYVKVTEKSKHTDALLHKLNDLVNRMRMNAEKSKV